MFIYIYIYIYIYSGQIRRNIAEGNTNQYTTWDLVYKRLHFRVSPDTSICNCLNDSPVKDTPHACSYLNDILFMPIKTALSSTDVFNVITIMNP